MDVRAWIQTWLEQRRPGDSIMLEVIELIEALEDEYSFMFTDEEMQAGLTNLADFERIVSAKSQARPSQS